MLAICGPDGLAEGGGKRYWQRRPERPRLYFSASDLPVLRQQLKGPPLSVCWQALKALCQEYMDPNSPRYVDFRGKKGSMWHTRDSVFELPPVVKNLSLTALLSGEVKYAAYAKQVLLTIIRDDVGSQVGGKAYGRPYRGWSGMDLSAIGLMFAGGYDFLYGYLSSTEKAMIRDEMLAPWFEQLFSEHREWRSRPTSNQRAYFYGNAALAVLALYDEMYRPQMDEIIATALEAVPAYLDVDVGRDGGCAEGAGYASQIMGIFELQHVLRRAGAQLELKRTDRLKNTVNYFVRQLLPSGRRINPVNQSFERMNCDLLLALACEFRDPVAMWAWHRHVQLSNVGGGIQGPRDLLWKLLLFDPSLEPVAPDKAGWPFAAAFRDHASVDIRTGWGHRDVMLTLQHGPGFAWGMPDMGNFTLHAMDEEFAADIGYGRWETSSNNCVIIDGKGQKEDWQGNPGGLADFEFLDHAQYARGNLLRQYPGAQRAERHSLFVQPRDALPWYVVIGDDFQMTDDRTHDYEWILITALGNTIRTQEPGRFTLVGKRNNLQGTVVVPRDVRLTVDEVSHIYYFSPSGEGSSAGDMRHWGDYPRLHASQHRQQGRFLIVMVPEGPISPSLASITDEESLGVRLRWGELTDEVVFRLSDAEPRWTYSRKRGA